MARKSKKKEKAVTEPAVEAESSTASPEASPQAPVEESKPQGETGEDIKEKIKEPSLLSIVRDHVKEGITGKVLVQAVLLSKPNAKVSTIRAMASKIQRGEL